MNEPLRVLVVVSGWPTDEHPHTNIFVVQETEFLRKAGVDVDVVPFRGAKNPLNFLRARRRVKRVLRAGDYDVVHAHFGQSALAVPASSPPLVVTFHGSDLLGIVGSSGRYTLFGRLLQALSRRAARRADQVILASTRLRPAIPSGIDYETLPAGVDPDLFKPVPRDEARRELGLPLDRKLVFFCGSPSVPRKRFGLAREAVALLDRGPVDLLTVVDKTRAEVTRYMNACDVVLLTSKHESGPAQVKEALAVDRPVVAVDVGDVRDMIAGVPGCELCADDRPETIAAALDRALDLGDDFEGRTAASWTFQDRLTPKLIGIYERLLERTKTTSRR